MTKDNTLGTTALVETLAQASETPRARVRWVLECLALIAADALSQGQRVRIPGIGILEARETKAREGKVVRVDQWLAQRGLDWAGVHLTFYSDSTNDLPLLEKSHTPVATNPDARLRAVAETRGWRILDLFPTTT